MTLPPAASGAAEEELLWDGAGERPLVLATPLAEPHHEDLERGLRVDATVQPAQPRVEPAQLLGRPVDDARRAEVDRGAWD
jgi:hypothetical protein